MAVEIEPPELAALLDTAERPRVENWSLRAALTRYAQPQPERASAVIEHLRRIESALRPHQKLFERDGATVWAAFKADDPASDVPADAIELLRALAELDRLGDVLAAWAVTGKGDRPDLLVDEVVSDVEKRLTTLGVPHEERPRPTGRRG